MKFILPGNVTAELANQFKNLIHMSLVVSFQAASASCFDLGQNVPIFHSGSRACLRMESYFWLNSYSLQNTERAIPENILCLLKHSFKLEIKKRVWCSDIHLVQ